MLHCIRFSSEGVPLGEENSLPVLFSQHVLGALAQRPQQGKGEERLRLTAVCVIRELICVSLSDKLTSRGVRGVVQIPPGSSALCPRIPCPIADIDHNDIASSGGCPESAVRYLPVQARATYRCFRAIARQDRWSRSECALPQEQAPC